MRSVTACLMFGVASLSAAPTHGQARADQGDLLQGAQIVDLTHPLNARSIFWPTAEKFRLEKVFEGTTDQGFHYAANNIHTAEHGGTHLDAPVHFAKGAWTADQIPLDRLVGRAVLVEVTRQVAANRDYEVRVRDFEAWEKRYGRIEPGSIVLIRTGYSRHWPDAKAYLGTAERGPQAVAKLHFPGLAPEAARWLVKQRSAKAVGIDTASIDFGRSTLFETHRALFEHNVPAFENLARLDALPPRGATVIALPMKIEGGSGGPLRAVALVREGP